jgi:hypothetical protein
MPRNPNSRCDLTWHQRYGTDNEGNLPDYKVGSNPCGVNMAGITYPGVTEANFRYMHTECPYSDTTPSGFHFVRDTDLSSGTYFQNIELDDPGDLSTHNDTYGIMIKEVRGSRNGWMCVDDNCAYYLSTGNRYFYF